MTLKQGIIKAVDYVVIMENERSGSQAKYDKNFKKISYENEKIQSLIDHLRKNYFDWYGTDRELFLRSYNLFARLKVNDLDTIIDFEL